MPQESPTSVTQFSDRPDALPSRLPVLPLRDVVIFPYMIFPVLVGRESSLHAVTRLWSATSTSSWRRRKTPLPKSQAWMDVYHEGTIAKIIQILKLPNGLMKILVDGVVQAAVKKFLPNAKYLEAQLTVNNQPVAMDSELDALLRHTSSLFAEYVHLNRNVPSEVLVAFENTRDPQRKFSTSPPTSCSPLT